MPQPGQAAPHTAAPAADRADDSRLSARTLITIGVFTAIYFVIMFGSGMIGMISPLASLIGFLVGILINGTVIMLFMVKTRAFGSMTILGAVVGLLMLLTGHFWATVVASTALGFIADLIAGSGRFRSRWRNVLGFSVFQLWIIAPLAPIFYDTAGYHAYVESSMGAEYADAWMTLFTPANLLLFGALFFLVSLVSGWLGTRVLDRNLSRAGVI